MHDEASPATLPADRRLDYPFLRFEGVQDDYETISNRDQLARYGRLFRQAGIKGE